MTDFTSYRGRPLDFADDMGINLLDWQREVVRDLLATGDDGRTLFEQAAVSVHRQGGKSYLLAFVGVYRFVCYVGDIVTAAQGVDGAKRTVRYARQMFRKNKALSRAVKAQRQRFLLVGSPFEWEITSSDSLQARGRTPRCVLGDEAGWWPASGEMLDTLSPALGAQDQPLLVLASTRGHKNSPLETLLALGGKLASKTYRFYSNKIVSPLVKPAFVAREKARMSALIFDREWKNLLHEGESEYATEAELKAAFSDHGRPDREAPRYAFVDLASSGVASGAIASKRSDGTVIIEELEVWKGSRKAPVSLASVEKWIERKCERLPMRLVQIESFQGERSVESLAGKGLPVVILHQSGPQKAGQLGNLMRLLQERSIALPRSAQLRIELEGSSAEPGPHGLKVTSVVHLDLTISVSGAALLATEEAEGPGGAGEPSFPDMARYQAMVAGEPRPADPVASPDLPFVSPPIVMPGSSTLQ